MKQSVAEKAVLPSCLLALIATVLVGAHWPLVGDSVLMHYVVWLMHHGFAPYRDIAEMNLPFTYLSENAAMGLFGAGDRGWRIYDGAIIAGLTVCCWRVLQQRGAAAGILAATVFATAHLQDGINMAGQRDLLVTLLQAAAGLALLRSFPAENATRAKRQSSTVATWSFVAGACGTAAASIKPPAILFLLAAVLWRLWSVRQVRPGRLAVAAGVAAGAVVALLPSLFLLRHFGALAAFLQDVHGLIAYHAGIERRSVGFLLGHAWAPVLPLLLLTAAALLLARTRLSWARVDTLCALGTGAGLASYLIQGKGFPYQRYPLLLWLLLLCMSRLWGSLRGDTGTPPARRVWLYAAVASAAVLIALFLLRGMRYSTADPYRALRADLRAEHAALADGRVQCLDTAGPCIGALYKEGLTQSTGFLYDCYLLDGSKPVVLQQRALFQQEWLTRPPELIVLTDSNCFTGPRTFDKYGSWPWMQQELTGYQLSLERHPAEPLHLWSRIERQYGYRILRRR